MAGIYFHIPFCKQACHYCNFFFTTSTKHLDVTTSTMARELDLRKKYLGNQEISSIYFGGGTPSMLPPDEIQFLIDKVRSIYSVKEDVEITLEANPDNLTRNYLKNLKTTEVNRFSIGIQSFFEEDLKWMNRAHNTKEALQCLELCNEYGYDNYSIDLIFGVPSSSSERWQKNLDKAISYKPHHISCYALTVEENTALHHHIKTGKSIAPKDEETEKQFFMAHDRLQHAGYNHYEISNYALEGQKSRHNSSYWEGSHYLGIGPGAHSFDGKSRSWNIEHLPKYIEAISKNKLLITKEVLSLDDQFNEWVMTSIRKKKGISIEVLHSQFTDMKEHVKSCLEEIPKEYLNINGEYISLTRSGLLFADFVGSMLFRV